MSYRLRVPPLVLVAIVAIISIGGTSDARPTAPGMGGLPGFDVTVRDASPAQISRLGRAFEAYSDAGLDLSDLDIPGLEIRFFGDEGACGGANGRFVPEPETWRIRICSTRVDTVYEHELAHVWERAEIADDQRRAFMTMRGFSNWSDQERPWRERGMEGAALVIQQGLSGLPLPPALSGDTVSRLRAYELLTGQAAPHLVDWLAERDVPCDQRPTPMSSWFPDESGLTCHRQLVPHAG